MPVVFFSEMFADLLGYLRPDFSGAGLIAPVLGTVIFVYGGQPFLTGGWSELKSRRPGMMLLISMAITVAFVASWVTTLQLGGFDLDFWWELALLIVIMLLGHWLEMRALGAASGALDALAALLPDPPSKVDRRRGGRGLPARSAGGRRRTRAVRRTCAGRRHRGRGPGRGRRVDDHRRIAAGVAGCR